MNYKQAGVDIEAGDALVEIIKPIAHTTRRNGAISSIGGFGAAFDPKAAGFVDPIICTSTDGVGTKLKIAIETNTHHSIGIDLVAMCVNDLICQGATPLSFQDYFATGKLDIGVAEQVITGIAKGCQKADCVLAGGETAEMPGMYKDGDYDLAGFAMGAVEREKMFPNIEAGDVLVGLASSGVHSNGFSLVRSIFADLSLKWDDIAPFSSTRRTFAQEFLKPTNIYVASILEMHQYNLIKAAAHITGGGLIGNIPRILPDGLRAVFEMGWVVPDIFGWLRKVGKISNKEMLRTFNCGIGMVLVVQPELLDKVYRTALYHSEWPIYLGHVESGDNHQIHLPEEKFWR